MEGGFAYFPGLSKPIVIDSDDLPEEEAHQLSQWVESAQFFNLPAIVGAPSRGAADYRQYTVTVESGGQCHTVRLTDLVEDPDLQALLDYLRTKTQMP